MNLDNTYEKIKKSVEFAKLESAEISGQIKGKISQLNELGITSSDPFNEADKYLNDQDTILDQQEKDITLKKQSIINEHTKIIQSTAPGIENG